MSARHPDPDFATTLAHGLEVLQSFTVSRPALGNKELAECTGLSKASITRLTTTLATRGLVIWDEHLRRYRLGSTALTIGYPLMASLRVRQLARARMKRLADEFGGSVSLGMRDRDRMVYVETCRGHDLSAWRPDIGAAIPMLPTAMGRAWLASAPEEVAHALVARLQTGGVAGATRADGAAAGVAWPSGSASASASASALEAAAAQATRNGASSAGTVPARGPAFDGWDVLARARAQWRRHGWCSSRGVWRPDVQAVAVPMGQPQLGETLVFNCGVLTARLGPRKLEREIAPRLAAMVRDIEADLAAAPEGRTEVPIAPRPNVLRETAGGADDGDRQIASTLAHGIDLLLSFDAETPTLANRDFAARTGLSRPAVARLTHTLTELGYLHRQVEPARYRLGAAVLGISHPLLAGLRIRPVARPMMEMLAREIRGAVSLGLRHRTAMVYVETARDADYLNSPDIGAPLPMLATAMGRAWLAVAPPEERRAVLNRLRLEDPQAFDAGLVDAARSELEQNGYCSARHAWRRSAHGFAVPLCDRVDGTQFILNCGVDAARGSFSQLRREVAPRLVALARSVEVLLGLR